MKITDMVLATNEFKLCPVCNKPLAYRTWEDPRENMTYLKLYCPNGCDYDKQYATDTHTVLDTVWDAEKNNFR